MGRPRPGGGRSGTLRTHKHQKSIHVRDAPAKSPEGAGAIAPTSQAVTPPALGESRSEPLVSTAPPAYHLGGRMKKDNVSAAEKSVTMSVREAVGVASGAVMVPARERDRAIADLQKALTHYRFATFAMAIVGIASSVAGAEMLFYNRNVPNAFTHAMKALTTATTVIMLFLLTLQYRADLHVGKLRGYLDDYETLWSSGLGFYFMIEAFVCAIHAPIGLDVTFTLINLEFPVTYSLDAVLSVWVLFRLYSFGRVFDDYAGFRSTNADVVARWNEVQFNTSFTFKTMMEQHPFRFVFSLLIFSIITCAYAIRVAERPVCAEWADVIHETCTELTTFDHFSTAVWSIFITMTTVGYGDVFPVTHAGRFVAVTACLVGLVLVALMVAVVTSASEFNVYEKRAYTALSRSITRQEFRMAAAKLIQRVWAYYKIRLSLLYPNEVLKFPTSRMMPPPSEENIEQSYRIVSGIFAVTTDRMTEVKKTDARAYRVRDGYFDVLSAIKEWKTSVKNLREAFKEKSEIILAVKEVLAVRSRINEVSEALAHYMAQQDVLLPAIWSQVRLLSERMGAPAVSIPAKVGIDPTLAPNISIAPAAVVVTLPRYGASITRPPPIMPKGQLTSCYVTVEHQLSATKHKEKIGRTDLALDMRAGASLGAKKPTAAGGGLSGKKTGISGKEGGAVRFRSERMHHLGDEEDEEDDGDAKEEEGSVGDDEVVTITEDDIGKDAPIALRRTASADSHSHEQKESSMAASRVLARLLIKKKRREKVDHSAIGISEDADPFMGGELRKIPSRKVTSPERKRTLPPSSSSKHGESSHVLKHSSTSLHTSPHSKPSFPRVSPDEEEKKDDGKAAAPVRRRVAAVSRTSTPSSKTTTRHRSPGLRTAAGTRSKGRRDNRSRKFALTATRRPK